MYFEGISIPKGFITRFKLKCDRLAVVPLAMTFKLLVVPTPPAAALHPFP